MAEDAVPSEVRAQLDARIDAFGKRLGRGTSTDLLTELNGLRRLARLHHIAPVLAVVALLDAALTRGERGALVLGGLGILRDAVGSARIDEQAASIFAAACSVRLAGG
jgi:hypothetical protein